MMNNGTPVPVVPVVPAKVFQCDYARQVWQAATDVILSTKQMLLSVDDNNITTNTNTNTNTNSNNNSNNGTDSFSTASSQVAADTKQLILLMFKVDDPLFSQQFLFDVTKALKTYILNLIKASKV